MPPLPPFDRTSIMKKHYCYNGRIQLDHLLLLKILIAKDENTEQRKGKMAQKRRWLVDNADPRSGPGLIKFSANPFSVTPITPTPSSTIYKTTNNLGHTYLIVCK